MADADWENDDFEPKVFKKPDDRWEGEDEEEDVKDNWDDEEEEEDSKDSDKPQQNVVAVQPKKKRPIAAIIAEKEEKKRKELEEKRKLAEKKSEEKTEKKPEEKPESAEEVLARKLEQQKLQEESDLELAKETFGVTVTDSDKIDHLNPSTKEEFDIFRKALIEKISKYESSVHYTAFLEDFCRELCLNLQPDDTKKISASLTALATEKLKAQKTAKSKKKSSKKATLNIGKDDLAIIDYGDEYDDYI